MCTFCEHEPRKVGEYFGFKKCCIDSFIEGQKKYGPGDMEHLTEYQLDFLSMVGPLGYLPCPNCAKEIIEEGLQPQDVIGDRVCPEPFPMYLDEDSPEHKAIEKHFLEWIKNNQ